MYIDIDAHIYIYAYVHVRAVGTQNKVEVWGLGLRV